MKLDCLNKCKLAQDSMKCKTCETPLTVLQSKLGVKFKTSSHARSNIYSQSYSRLCIARPSGIIPFGWRGEITGKKSAFAGYCSNETAINFK